MLTPYLDQKAVPHDGPRLLPCLIGYVFVDDWWRAHHPSTPPKPGRPVSFSESEIITLAILAQWPRFRSERDFWRFARRHLREYFPAMCSQSQFNRRVRALEPQLRDLQREIADTLLDGSEVYPESWTPPSSQRS
jgi:hypothetical protein